MQLDLFTLLVSAMFIAIFAQILSRRARQPPVILEMVLGIIAGGAGIAAVSGNGASPLQWSESLADSLHMVATLVCSFIALSAATESRHRHEETIFKMAIFSVAGIVFSFAAASLFHLLYFNGLFELSTVFFLTACFMVTAVPVLLRIITECGIPNRPLAKLAMSNACVMDILAWVVISFSIYSEMHRTTIETSKSHYIFFFILILGSIVLFRFSSNSKLDTIGGLYFAIIATFAGGALSALFGLPIYFGIFVYGFLLGSNPDIKQAVESVIKPFSSALLIIYFLDIGTTLSWSAANLHTLYFSAIAIILGLSAKIIQCLILKKLFSLRNNDSIELSILLNSRGLMEIVFLQIGREKGLIDDQLFMIFLLMAIISTMLTGPLLRLNKRLFKASDPISIKSNISLS